MEMVLTPGDCVTEAAYLHGYLVWFRLSVSGNAGILNIEGSRSAASTNPGLRSSESSSDIVVY